MKKEKLKIYVMVNHRDGSKEKSSSATLLNCDKLQTITPFAPTQEILQTHVQAERVRLAIAEIDGITDAIVHPLYLEIDACSYDAIITELKYQGYKVHTNYIYLTLGGIVPCCALIKSGTVENPEPEVVTE